MLRKLMMMIFYTTAVITILGTLIAIGAFELMVLSVSLICCGFIALLGKSRMDRASGMSTWSYRLVEMGPQIISYYSPVYKYLTQAKPTCWLRQRYRYVDCVCQENVEKVKMHTLFGISSRLSWIVNEVYWSCIETEFGDLSMTLAYQFGDKINQLFTLFSVFCVSRPFALVLRSFEIVVKVWFAGLLLGYGVFNFLPLFWSIVLAPVSFLSILPIQLLLLLDSVVCANRDAGNICLRQQDNEETFNELCPEHIRILIVYPGIPGDPIDCTLRHARFDSVRYEALSYVWGLPQLDCWIRIDGRPFAITRNLYIALAHLRQKERPRMLWIDAVCINQANDKERTNQVLLMNQIYRSAAKVIVWLGPEPVGIINVFRRRKSDYHFGTVRAISKLLSTSWWTRVWTVQEIVMAKEVVVQCGQSWINWDDFSRLIHAVCEHQCFRASETYIEEFRVLKRTRNKKALTSTPPYDLLSLAYDFRGRRAKDPRDKLFALLGLLEPETSQTQTIRPIPKYLETEGAAQVSCNFARRCINRFGSLSIMALADCGRPTGFRTRFLESGPSFCPVWSGDANNFQSLPFWTGDLESKENRFSWQREFKAAGGLKAVDCTLNTTDTAIRVRGWIADVIMTANIPTVITSRTTFFSETFGNVKSILRCKSLKRKDNPSTIGYSSWPSFHKAMTAGIYDAYPVHGSEDEHKYLAITKEICAGKQFYVTAKGRFGLGPADVKVGDYVCVLLGSDVPMILRSQYGHEQKSQTKGYVGQTYVDELMFYDGDIERDIETRSLVLEDFYLT